MHLYSQKARVKLRYVDIGALTGKNRNNGGKIQEIDSARAKFPGRWSRSFSTGEFLNQTIRAWTFGSKGRVVAECKDRKRQVLLDVHS